MKVVLASDASDDLREIGDYIAQDNPERARSFVAELLVDAHAISDVPEGYPLVERYAHLGIRRKAHGRYLIFYSLDADQVTVIHILHGARDYEALIFPDE